MLCGTVGRHPPLQMGVCVSLMTCALRSRRGHALLALDVAYDTHMNAHVLDVNSGPSFYHILPPNNWPQW